MAAMEGRCVHSSTGTPPLRPGRCWRSPFAGDWLPWNRALGLWSYGELRRLFRLCRGFSVRADSCTTLVALTPFFSISFLRVNFIDTYDWVGPSVLVFYLVFVFVWSTVMEYSFLPPLEIEFLVVNRNGIHAQGESNSCGT